MVQFNRCEYPDMGSFFTNRNDNEVNEYIEYFYSEAIKSFEVIINELLHKTVLPEKAIDAGMTDHRDGLSVGIDMYCTNEACIKNNIDTSHTDPSMGFYYVHNKRESKEGNTIICITVLAETETTFPTFEIDANDPDLFEKLKMHLHTLIEIATSTQAIEDFIAMVADEIGYERKNESLDR